MTGIISPMEADEGIGEVAETPEQLAAVRELVLRAHPEIVPELLHGDSIEGLLASVQPATAAYARIAELLKQDGAGTAAALRVPAGGSPAVVVQAEKLPAGEKIRRGLESRRRD